MGLSAPTVFPLSVSFLRSVMVGDEGSIFTRIARVGRTSLTIRAEAWRRDDSEG
ncbi:hotdog domain-containing protein [Roseovarius sp.]|uniref:hotdog domain-containing protein n=1 Tax=Roseovarius sp. TaxID=1486281 RepID=UPI003B5A1D32